MLDRVKQLFASPARPLKPARAPILSIIVVAYDMAQQVQNTLLSLASGYQRGVAEADYEVLVVENDSANLIAADFIQSLPANFHYFRRTEREVSPANAIQFAASRASGAHICLMIDGARMLSPGVVQHVIMGHRLHPMAVVTVPGYHLGAQLQQDAVKSGYGFEEEQRLVRSINWPEDGYRLFEIACFSGSCEPGFFLPNSESNCISIPRDIWEQLGGCDPAFDLRGGGLINLDLYKRACEFPGVQHVMLPGEGTFHQFHGGVTTGGEDAEDTQTYMRAIYAQYRQLRGHEHVSPQTTPVFIGQLAQPAEKFLLHSLEMRSKLASERH